MYNNNNWQNDFQRQQELNNASDRIAAALAAQKNEDRKHLLRIEIAKATDRRVKAELQSMLDEIERKEKRNKIIAFILLFIVMAVAAFIGFFFYNQHLSNKSTISNNAAAISSTNISSDSNPRNNIDTKQLTQEQVKKWVYYHMKKDNPNISGSSAYDFSIVPNQDSELEISVSSGGTPVNDYLIDSSGDLYNISSGQKTLLSKNWDVPNNFELDEPTQTDIKQANSSHEFNSKETEISSTPENQSETTQKNLKITNFNEAVTYLKDKKKYWSYSPEKNSDTTEIISINENHPELQSDDLGSYYIIIVNTDDDDGSIYGGTKQFKVYNNGLIQQRAGMNGFYTIFE
ncbi:hypothetical protein GVK83_13205 [Enterococcus hirae]|uniref:hypothetical protein n=1 Tax=Enterococcus hirae TaxID=1354 RepID=UPI0013735EDD|nr:hypothetical protein [Enterococcus hirae]NBA28544.1 hypothetical protein [Enterococcus hirae]NBA37726.1 hypothetical protein [Enterococcus hirae]